MPPHPHARPGLRRLALVVVPALAALLLAAGPASADVQIFTNPAPIAVPGSGTSGPGSPYPSTLTVNGMSGPVTDVNVTLRRIGHNFPRDVDVLLVSPSGDTVIVMSGVCGDAPIEDNTWTFDQQAAVGMFAAGPCDEFFYRPTGVNSPGPWPGPAPAGPHGSTLNDFNGEDANGTWRLYAADGSAGDVGDIEQGWTLTISTGPVDTAIPGTGSSGSANPYPATRTVSSPGAVITDLNVGIDGIWHQRPDDLDLLLVGPQGQKAVLMSDACGSFPVTAYGWFWNDEAAAPMPDGDGTNLCGTTSHRPTDHDPGDSWPAPAPPGPYGAALSAFDLTDPNGEWRLFVHDDSSDKVGFFTNRFLLTMSTRPKAAVAFTQSQVEVAEGTTRELTVTRTGPATLGAGSVAVTSVPATATAGSDFSAVSTVIDFAPGEAQKNVAIDALADAADEPGEAYAVSIGSPTGDAALPTPSSVTVTIPAPPGGDPGGGDATAPAFVGAARAVPRTFAAGPARAVKSARRKLARGTTFRYALSEPARVVFAVERRVAGRRVGNRCSKPARANRGKRPCARYVRSGALAQEAGAGPNRRRFSGRIAGRRLAAGHHRATLVATDAAGTCQSRSGSPSAW